MEQRLLPGCHVVSFQYYSSSPMPIYYYPRSSSGPWFSYPRNCCACNLLSCHWRQLVPAVSEKGGKQGNSRPFMEQPSHIGSFSLFPACYQMVYTLKQEGLNLLLLSIEISNPFFHPATFASLMIHQQESYSFTLHSVINLFLLTVSNLLPFSSIELIVCCVVRGWKGAGIYLPCAIHAVCSGLCHVPSHSSPLWMGLMFADLPCIEVFFSSSPLFSSPVFELFLPLCLFANGMSWTGHCIWGDEVLLVYTLAIAYFQYILSHSKLFSLANK